ncbi:hypothetical protein [Aurantiacibacter luteus]|uniref:Lipoprotein n=1 Tax=Aurantiacibacter luteus TaxID=1581420 RepID=A0A0G9MW21_9SPHN|nr:hypothetical protein [Aurantiacibacter luteus]KLE34926.1 hypothetical protein AAW00_11230 [Aurantiacibacter luteus]
MSRARMPVLACLATLALALSACDAAPEATAPDPAADAPAADVETPAPNSDASIPAAQPVTAIPAAMQGRWGMTEADCDPNEPANKGLMTIDGTTLTFYESVAEIGQAMLAGDNALRGTFDYEGEGMQWSRDLTLTLSGPDTLVLEEIGDDAPPGPRSYSKCN